MIHQLKERLPFHSTVEQAASPESRTEIWRMIEAEYLRTISALNAAGALEYLPELGGPGIRDERGRGYLLPTSEQIQTLCEQNWPLIEKKWAQGFTKLQLTPMAMPILRLMQTAQTLLSVHAKRGHLFSPLRNPGGRISIPDKGFPLHYFRTNVSSNPYTMTYFPKHIRREHGGQSKDDVIEQTTQNGIAGWHVCFIEDQLFVAQMNRNDWQNMRRPLYNGTSVDDYLATVKKPAYAGETGFTTEDFLTRFLIQIIETGDVIGDVDSGNGFVLFGTYLPQDETIPIGNFWRRHRRLELDQTGPTRQRIDYGTRTAVRLFHNR